jgi:hypothetical protein
MNDRPKSPIELAAERLREQGDAAPIEELRKQEEGTLPGLLSKNEIDVTKRSK